MYQPKYVLKKKRKPHYRGTITVLMIIGLLVISFFCLAFLKQKEAITLVHTWQSKETGEVLTFTKDGKVTFKNNLPEGVYRIISPNTIEYTVGNMSFQMIYTIQDNKLHWGIDQEHLEIFSPK